MSAQIDFQAHGRYHFSLLTLDDDRLQEELLESKAEVEQLTNQSCDHFSFPYGDYSDREIEAVRRCGYRTARTTEPGWNDQSSDRHRLKILADVPGTVSVNALRAHLSGIPRLLKRLAYLRVTHAIHGRRQEFLMRRRFLHGVPER